MPALAQEVEYVARIHPREPTRGYVRRTVLLSNSGYPKFEVTRGWYSVDKGIIPRLEEMRNYPEDPHSRPVFQICTKAEALALEKAEEIAAAKATDPIPVPVSRERKIGKPARRVDPLPERVRDAEEEERQGKRYIETADPEDPEDAEFVIDDEDDDEKWSGDLAPTQDEFDEDPPAAVQEARSRARADKAEAAGVAVPRAKAAAKKPRRKAKKKAKKRPTRKTKG